MDIIDYMSNNRKWNQIRRLLTQKIRHWKPKVARIWNNISVLMALRAIQVIRLPNWQRLEKI